MPSSGQGLISLKWRAGKRGWRHTVGNMLTAAAAKLLRTDMECEAVVLYHG